jgi:MFS family permease
VRVVDTSERSRSVWAQPAFRYFWLGLTASYVGSQVTRFALPLVAVLALEATASQVGILNALTQLPYLLIALLAGVYVDRASPRRVLIAADIGRLAILTCVPLLAAFGVLQMGWLYLVAFGIGCFTVLFDIASQSYLPRIVDRSQLAAGNGALEASHASANIAGPAVGGVLVQVLTAPFAMVVAAFAYLGSIVALFRTSRVDAGEDRSATFVVHRQLMDGLRMVLGNEILRVMAIIAGVYNLFFAGFQTVNILYLARELQLTPAQIGIVLGALGPGLLLGAALAAWMARTLGYGRSVILTAIGANGVVQGIAVVHSNGIVAVSLLVAINIAFGTFGLSHAILMRSIRQAMTPAGFLGRIAATNRFLAQGATPLGALFGGFLAAAADLRIALLAMTLGMLSVVVVLARSPLPRIGKDLPNVIST